MSSKITEKLISESIKSIYIGTWFQRTRLHLSEIYDYLKTSSSPLDLNQRILKNNLTKLEISDIKFNVSDLDYLEIHTHKKIKIKIYEDGLIVLNMASVISLKDITALANYYEDALTPAIKYLFSLGIPLPKELAAIKSVLPYFLILKNANKALISIIFKSVNEHEYTYVDSKTLKIYRGDKLYIINSSKDTNKNVEKYIEEQIFLREYIAQLHRYLNMHRVIWEKIARLIERKEIKGYEIPMFKAKIERYAKTINLINTRLRQINSYFNTRESIIKNNKDYREFLHILNYKYSTLKSTSSYIADLWEITNSYVIEAKVMLTDLETQSTQTSLQNLTIVTTVGVGASLISLFTRQFPTFNTFGFLYFAILVAIGYVTNTIIKLYYKYRKYSIKNIEIDKKIK